MDPAQLHTATHLKASLMTNLDGILASAAGVAGTVTLASGVAPVPENLPSWVPYLGSVVVPVAIYLLNRALGARAARKDARAGVLDARAKALRADNDPDNDLQAAALELEAAEERAEAAALKRQAP